MKRFILIFAESVISVSNAIREDSCKNSIVIGNPYRDKIFRVLEETKKRETVAFLGRFVSDKGIEMLIDAYSRINQTDNPLTLIGSGPDKLKYIELACRKNVTLRFTGNLFGDELVEELNKHKILVIPSIWNEPFGNVALEGMACGCLVLASNGGGLPDAVGKAGMTFQRGCIEDLIKKLNLINQIPEIEYSIRSYIEEHLRNHLEEIVCDKYLKELEKANRNSNTRKKPSNQ